MQRAIIQRAVFPSLLLPYLISLIGMFSSYFAFFHRDHFQLAVVQEEESKLKSLSFTSEEFLALKWTDGQKEFEFEGRMFDVAQIKRQGTSYVIYCENDFLEDLLVDFLKTTGGKTKTKGIAQVQFVQPIPDFSVSPIAVSSRRKRPTDLNSYHSLFPEISTPPPRQRPIIS